MKIGDRIFVRGYIDEIRKDTVIIRNAGGYFGTVPSEVTGELPSAQPEQKKGEWIPYLSEGLRYKCSECESKYEIPWLFCPNCGSYNGGGHGENG